MGAHLTPLDPLQIEEIRIIYLEKGNNGIIEFF
jgi:hypothetical protein